jgi:phage host-nuclease inhibitor protein Gam
MTPLQHPHQPDAPRIQNREELDAVVENIVQLQLERDELEIAREQEITAIRRKYGAPLAELERYLRLEMSWVTIWATEHPGEFSDRRTLECAHATIGFCATPPRVARASRKWTWSGIAARLGETTWGRHYLRQTAPEVDKEALLADRLELDADELRQAGLKIVQDERFYITPHDRVEETLIPDEPVWQEAA